AADRRRRRRGLGRSAGLTRSACASLERGGRALPPHADSPCMEQGPLADRPAPADPDESGEPKLELLPQPEDEEVDDPDAEPEAAAELDAEPADDLDSEAQVHDPLKLYVRQIGDGRLLTAAEERELA